MSIVKYTLLFFIIIFSFLCQASIEKKDLIWLTDDDKDLTDLKMFDKDISIGTDTTNLVLKELSDYNIDFQLVQIPRAGKLMKGMGNVCISNRIKTEERQVDNVFSFPVNIFPGLRLYYLKDQKRLLAEGKDTRIFNEQGELRSLSVLFNIYPDSVIAITKGRSFGEAVDKQLQQVSNHNKLTRAGDGRYYALIQMLIKGRIDFLIDFPVEIKRELTGDTKEHNLSNVPIANIPEYIVGHIACSDSLIGHEVIKKVNNALTKLYRNNKFYQAHTRYILQSDLINFDRYYLEVFKVAPPNNE